jgi:hypothetical protein
MIGHAPHLKVQLPLVSVHGTGCHVNACGSASILPTAQRWREAVSFSSGRIPVRKQWSRGSLLSHRESNAESPLTSDLVGIRTELYVYVCIPIYLCMYLCIYVYTSRP